MPAPTKSPNLMSPKLNEFIEMKLYALYNETPLEKLEAAKRDLKESFSRDFLKSPTEINQMCSVLINVATNFRDTFHQSPADLKSYLFNFLKDTDLIREPLVISGLHEATKLALKRIDLGIDPAPVSERSGEGIQQQVACVALRMLRKEIVIEVGKSKVAAHGEEFIIRYSEPVGLEEVSFGQGQEDLFVGRWTKRNELLKNVAKIDDLLTDLTTLVKHWK